MRIRLACVLAGLSATLLWAGAGTAAAGTAAAATTTVPASVTSLAPGQSLRPGTALRSPGGRYLLRLHTDGGLTVTGHGRTLWRTATRGANPVLLLRANDNLVLESGGHVLWQTGTTGATHARLRLTDSGSLTLTAAGGTAWSDTLGNGCAGSRGAHHVVVDISQQRARLCARHQQVLVTSVTTGASGKGDATPTGTWHVYAKVRDTVLYPAGGGAYHVHYWMPYDGAYGMHDSPWQRFAYGSPRYKTGGSHGCVHFPAAAMARLFAWAPTGTTVTVQR